MKEMVKTNQIEAYNLPLGQLSHMIRDAAAKKVGPISKIGLKTFVDPREKGGKKNDKATDDVVHLIKIEGEEYLH